MVARLLTPEDYGLVGMATVYLGLVSLVSEAGIGSAIIQRRFLEDAAIARLGGFAVAVGIVLFLVSLVLSGPIAGFFSEPAVRPVVIVLASSFVISAFKTVPYSLMARDLEFRRLAWVDGIEALSLTFMTLGLAVAGLDYWALVLGSVSGRIVGAIGATAFRPHRLRWPGQLSTVRSEIGFGVEVTLSRIAWYIYSHADFAIVGRLLGKAALGAYTLGWTISSVPVEKISALYQRVTPSILASVQEDPAEINRYVCRITEVLAVLIFPAAVGVALVADLFVNVVLGAAWRSAALPIALLGISAMARGLDPILAQVLIATGRARANLNTMAFAAILMPMLFGFGTLWGTTGVCVAWVTGHPLIVTTRQLLRVREVSGLRLSTYIRSLGPAAHASAVMAVVVGGLRVAMGPTALPVAELVAAIGVGALTYVGTLFVWHRPRLRAFRSAIASIRNA